jgi:hypothetical protein
MEITVTKLTNTSKPSTTSYKCHHYHHQINNRRVSDNNKPLVTTSILRFLRNQKFNCHLKKIIPSRPRTYAKFCNMLVFTANFVSLRSTLNLSNYPLSTVSYWLLNTFAAISNTWTPFPSSTWRRSTPWWQETHHYETTIPVRIRLYLSPEIRKTLTEAEHIHHKEAGLLTCPCRVKLHVETDLISASCMAERLWYTHKSEIYDHEQGD